jgi:phosphatidylglycerol:prolipoprotein diacylglycerol transferase
MIFFITNLFICFFIFLFCLYLLARDDFILLRKSITLEQIFNYAFISALIALLSGRIMYVFFHPSLQYLNPLIFLIFIYFPGISVVGAIIGVIIFLFFISRKKKVPRGRIYDVFSLSFLTAFASNLIITQLFSVIFT